MKKWIKIEGRNEIGKKLNELIFSLLENAKGDEPAVFNNESDAKVRKSMENIIKIKKMMIFVLRRCPLDEFCFEDDEDFEVDDDDGEEPSDSKEDKD